jgi:hypothetical protein
MFNDLRWEADYVQWFEVRGRLCSMIW